MTRARCRRCTTPVCGPSSPDDSGSSGGHRSTGIAELAGVSDSLLTTFSERTGQVAARYQIKLDRFRETLGREPTRRERWRLEREAAADSRPAKRHDHPLTELQQRWTATLADGGLTPERLLDTVIGRHIDPVGITTADADLISRGALFGLEESQSTWRRNEVIARSPAASRPRSPSTPTDSSAGSRHRRAPELHQSRQTDRRRTERRPLSDDQLRALCAERGQLRALDPEGHARHLEQLQQVDADHRQRLAEQQAQRDRLINERIELTGERAHLSPVGHRRLRSALDQRIANIELELRQVDQTTGDLRVGEIRRGAKLRLEQRWHQEHPDALQRYQELDTALQADARIRGEDLARDPSIELIERLGSPPLHDQRALHTWELRAGELAQRRITRPTQLGVDIDHGVDRVTTPEPTRTIEPDHGLDLGLGL